MSLVTQLEVASNFLSFIPAIAFDSGVLNWNAQQRELIAYDEPGIIEQSTRVFYFTLMSLHLL